MVRKVVVNCVILCRHWYKRTPTDPTEFVNPWHFCIYRILHQILSCFHVEIDLLAVLWSEMKCS